HRPILAQHVQAAQTSYTLPCLFSLTRRRPPPGMVATRWIEGRWYHSKERVLTELYTTKTTESADGRPLEGLLSDAPRRAILVSVEIPSTDWPIEESLDELERLATTAGVTCMDRVVQRLARPNPATLLGSGKVEELAQLARFHDCDAV